MLTNVVINYYYYYYQNNNNNNKFGMETKDYILLFAKISKSKTISSRPKHKIVLAVVTHTH